MRFNAFVMCALACWHNLNLAHKAQLYHEPYKGFFVFAATYLVLMGLILTGLMWRKPQKIKDE